MSTTLKAVHLVDEGAYIISPAWGFEYEADGVPLPKGRDSVISDINSVVRVVRSRGDVLHWQDKDGNVLPTLDYDDRLAALKSGATHDDDGEIHFADIDAEYEYKKFIARWATPVRGPDTVRRETVAVDVAEVRVRSGDDDIVSLWNSPAMHTDSRLYSINRDGVMDRSCREQCVAAGLSLDIPSHSGLRFAKIEGEYAFDESFNANGRPFIGTLAQCAAEKERLVSRVAEVVRIRSAKKRNVSLPNAADVALRLREIRGQMASASSRKSALRKVDELIAGIEAGL